MKTDPVKARDYIPFGENVWAQFAPGKDRGRSRFALLLGEVWQ